MKRIIMLIGVLLLAGCATTVSADDAYQRGYQMGADSKAFMDGWEAAHKEAPPEQKAAIPSKLKDSDFADIFKPWQPSNRYEHKDVAPTQGQTQDDAKQLLTEWKATFVPEKGNRIDYIPKDDGFKVDNDGLSSKFEFTVHEDGISATIRMSGGNIKKPETYEAAVLQYGMDMLVIASRYGAIQNIDKTEIYTLYPKMGIGFLNITSAYAGDFVIKAAARSNKSIPAASSITFPLRMAK